ncbi:hypothetical protein AcV5_002136 [Taiwanofungus camphoratus]|nr:hypothetical protein AcV5_002136 [Antrodia cinnamomea]
MHGSGRRVGPAAPPHRPFKSLLVSCLSPLARAAPLSAAHPRVTIIPPLAGQTAQTSNSAVSMHFLPPPTRTAHGNIANGITSPHVAHARSVQARAASVPPPPTVSPPPPLHRRRT